MVTKLRYGNTNTFLIKGRLANVLIVTDYAGTLPAFYKALKEQGLSVKDIDYVLATHYHPDHMGLISELTGQGVKLFILESQTGFVHYSDAIFARDKRLQYEPIDESGATVISADNSRMFLASLGIDGEIIQTPSHSEDSISVILDEGVIFVGDLEPYEYLEAYDDNKKLKEDWDKVMSYNPKVVYYAHANEKHC